MASRLDMAAVGHELRKEADDARDTDETQQPAGHDRRLRTDDAGDGRRLDVAKLRAAADRQHMDRRDPAAEPVWRLELDERRAEHGREHISTAGDREKDE